MNKSDFEIEEVTDLDAVWPDLVALFRGQVSYHEPWVRRTLRADWEQRWRDHIVLDGNCLVLIARKAGEAVGFVSATFNADYGLFEEQFGFLDDAYVAEAARRQGLGTLLLERVEAWCRARGASELRLQVRIENERAVRFWTDKGFARELQRMHKSLTETPR